MLLLISLPIFLSHEIDIIKFLIYDKFDNYDNYLKNLLFLFKILIIVYLLFLSIKKYL